MTTIQEVINYYEEEKKRAVRLMNENCSEYFAWEGIRLSKILDALYQVKQDGVFE